MTLALLLAVGVVATQPPCEPCVVGVVLDGPSEAAAALGAAVEAETAALAAPRFTVAFARRTADWTPAGVRDAMDALLADPDVHVVIALGRWPRRARTIPPACRSRSWPGRCSTPTRRASRSRRTPPANASAGGRTSPTSR